jgi:integrase/recombinase XerD
LSLSGFLGVEWWTDYLPALFDGGRVVRVAPVVLPHDGLESWTVVDDEGFEVEAIESFLAHLTAVERSPNTVRAYAHDLRDFFAFLGQRGVEWSAVRLEDVGGFVAWLRLPPAARDGRVVALPSAEVFCSAATVNRKLSALSSFYEFHARHGVDLGELLTAWRPGGRGGSWKPFLAHLGERGSRRRTVVLRAERRAPRVLTGEQITAILEACVRLRDRFLFALLAGSGLRIGEALGLRHEDISAHRSTVTVRPRRNANRARVKSWSRTVPVAPELVELYSDYLHVEYGELDSDYVFVNLWGGTLGAPLTYAAVHRLVDRLRARTGIEFTPHWLRHTYATDLLRRGTPVEVVRKLLGHASVATTIDVYSHLDVEDARRVLENMGVLPPGEAQG